MDNVCCVCGVALGDEPRRIGGRSFCAKHYAKATRPRRRLWLPTAATVIGLLIVTLLAEFFFSRSKVTLHGTALFWWGIVLSLVPALAWMVVIYLQDRLEPEPIGNLLGIFGLGALLALTLGLPLVRQVFHVQTWLGRSGALAQLLGSILIVGFTQEYLKYAAVRYTIYNGAEFDERVDGIIYGTAAGLGFATVLNIYYLLASDGAQMGVSIVRIVVTALAQASFSGVVGYFLGRAKFEVMGRWWLPAGVALAAMLNGVVTFLLGEVSSRGLAFTPTYGLVLVALVAVGTFVAVFWLIQRAIAATVANV
jgi:protease PrsW